MGLLRYKDYEQLIQNEDLEQIIQNDKLILNGPEQASESEVKGYLAQRYRVDKIFSPTTEFSISKIYKGNQLVEYTAPTFNSTATYQPNDRIVFSGSIYSAITTSTAIQPGSTGDTGVWNYIASDKDLFYVKLPYPEFDYKTSYLAGDVVWFDDVVYTALVNTKSIVPGTNISVWSPGQIFTITGHYPEDTNYWTKGDNRNAQLVQILIDVTLYHLFSRLNPRLITQLRMTRYNGDSSSESSGAKGWLKDVARGKVIADLPEILPTTGLITGWGHTSLRRKNTY